MNAMTPDQPALTVPAALPPLVERELALFACPGCGASLHPTPAGDGLECDGCRRVFAADEGIPRLFWPNDWDGRTDVTETVKAFYEENPFPSYDDIDTRWTLAEKAERSIFYKMLNDQVPQDARVLEVGCGTGQLSNYLGLRPGRTVLGADLCLNSLRLGQGFRSANQISNVAFLQMNLFRPPFKPSSFDLVIGSGVLHHTSDPLRGFGSIAALVKPGGHIVIGLYNSIGRMTTHVRRLLFRLSRRLTFLDPRMRDRRLSDERRRIWLMDQYYHPHESCHSYGEVLRWFEGAGFTFMNSIPKAVAADEFSPGEKLFTPHPPGTRLDHGIVQFGLIFSGSREGGFFTMIGRRQGGQPTQPTPGRLTTVQSA